MRLATILGQSVVTRQIENYVKTNRARTEETLCDEGEDRKRDGEKILVDGITIP